MEGIATKSSERTYKEYDFTEKEKCVIEYIMNNPGATKQDVVDNNKSGYPRNSILRTIKELHNF